MFARAQSFSPTLNKSPLVIAFDHQCSPADILEHLNCGREVVGAGDIDKGIRAKLPDAAPYGRMCSRRVLETFAVLRALGLHCYPEIVIGRLGADDRLADNLELISDAYQIPGLINRRTRAEAYCELLESASKPGSSFSSAVGNFLQRTPTELFKMITFHLQISSLEMLGEFVDNFRFKHDPTSQSATETLSEHSYAFLEMVLASGTFTTVEEFVRFLKSDELRELSEFYGKVGFSNMSLLNDHYVFEGLKDAEAFFQNKRVRENLMGADCQRLMGFVTALDPGAEESERFFLDLITESYTPEAEASVQQVCESGLLKKLSPQLTQFLKNSLLHANFIRQNLTTAAVLHGEGLLKSESSAVELQILSQTLKELLEPKLAIQFLRGGSETTKQRMLREFREHREAYIHNAEHLLSRKIYNELNCTKWRKEGVITAIDDEPYIYS